MQLRLGLLFLACTSAQLLLYDYPDDRSRCRSDDIGCIVGNIQQAAIFPIRTGERRANCKGTAC